LSLRAGISTQKKASGPVTLYRTCFERIPAPAARRLPSRLLRPVLKPRSIRLSVLTGPAIFMQKEMTGFENL